MPGQIRISALFRLGAMKAWANMWPWPHLQDMVLRGASQRKVMPALPREGDRRAGAVDVFLEGKGR